MEYIYDSAKGVEYARYYANYYSVREDKRLFYYDNNDCTNFCSQCVWAAYGGWLPGDDEPVIKENKERIKRNIRMIPSIWYGSGSFGGSGKWCRVVEFYDYLVSKKNNGPLATKIYEGEWQTLNPSIVNEGDVIQMVIKSYASYRYGHCLYVTQRGNSLDQIKICCHTYDRRDAPLSGFSNFSEEYTKLRVIRFQSADFIK